MRKYINELPKTLLDDFVNNRVVPIVGAGFSKNAYAPNEKTIPDWEQLGRQVGEYIPGYVYTNALDAISLFESQFSKVKLIELLSELLNVNELKPSTTHHAFCDLFVDTICTTNFDFLIEQTLQETHRPHSIVVSEERLAINTKAETKVIKLHGDFNHPEKMILTESDYDSFLNKNKILATYIANIFITKTLILVGYSFEDIDTRNIWKIINDRLGELARPAYVVLVNATAIEISRFERRGIRVINLKGKKEEYPQILKGFFSEIKAYTDEKRAENIKTTNERAQGELKLPIENKRLCFVSAGYDRLSYLKELIYPVLKKHGITPITYEELIMPGESWLFKCEALLKEASIVIVDVSSSNESTLWELVTVRNMQKQLVIIEEEDFYISRPQSLIDLPHISYSMHGNNERFSAELERAVLMYLEPINDEPYRLLSKREYEAAVISAFRLLEMTLSERGYMHNEQGYRSVGLKKMLDNVRDEGVNQIVHKVQSYLNVRNQIVHGNAIKITKKEATEIVETVMALVNNLN